MTVFIRRPSRIKNAATTNARMFRRFVAAIVAATAVVASITDCDPTSVFRPTELGLVPDPPVRGQPVVMTVKFTNPGADINDGKAVTSITLNGLPLTPSTESLCANRFVLQHKDVNDEVSYTSRNTLCPIVSGANDRTATSTWPDTVSGKIVSKSQWFGPAGESLLCVQTNVRVAATEIKQLRGSAATMKEEVLAALRHVFQHDATYKGLVPYVHPPTYTNDTCPLLSVLDA